MSNNHNIENIFKEAFESFSVNPSDSLWTKISRKLFLNDFLKFNPGKFNIYYSIIIIAASSLILYTINQSSTTSNTHNIVENQKDINTLAQDSNNNTISLNSENDNDIVPDNTEIMNNESNTNETNILTNTELHNTTVETDYDTNERTNIEEKINNSKLAKPYANFSVSEDIACEPVAITFFNASENCDKYLWDFGNGKTSSLENPTFVFRTAGTYTVKLTVSSGSNSNSNSTAVKEIKINKKPTASFQIKNKKNLFTDDIVYFTNISSDFHKSIWDFGDGSSSTYTHTEHSYTSEGSFNVSLICKTDKNCADTSFMKALQIKDERYKINAPTGLYENTTFFPIIDYGIAEYHLTIYTRFGSKVFESNDPNIGWEGYYNGSLPTDITVFVWKCSVKFIDGETSQKTGNLTFYPRK